LASGCISGFLTATVTFPLDVVRRRMQVRASNQPYLQCGQLPLKHDIGLA
jgi:hypothetical protein